MNFFFSFLIPFLLLMWNPVRKSVVGPTLAGVSVLIGALFMAVRWYVPSFGIQDVTAHGLNHVPPIILPDILDLMIISGGLCGAVLLYMSKSHLFGHAKHF